MASEEYFEDAEESVGLLLKEYQEGEPKADLAHKVLSKREQFCLTCNIIVSGVYKSSRLCLHGNVESVWHAIRPQFASPRAQRKLHETSWLDGLRGLAALSVVLHHASSFVSDLRGRLLLDFPHLLEWPLISVMLSGSSMVDIFFVVSGYCLSYKSLRNAREGKDIFSDLSSSTFRRAIRLCMPCLLITLITANLSYMGFGVRAPHPQETWPGQMYAWAYDFTQGMNPYHVVTDISAFAFGSNLWTIPVEFRGSLHVFLCLLALGRAKTHIRLLALLFIEVHLSLIGCWDVLLFNSGIIACELKLIYQHWRDASGSRILGNDSSPRFAAIKTSAGPNRYRLRGILLIAVSTFGFLLLIHILSMRVQPHDYGPLQWMYAPFEIKSPDSWYHAEPGEANRTAGRPISVLAAFLLVLHVDMFFPQAKAFIFERRFPQYLGDISYSMYLVHEPLLGVTGNFCFGATWVAFNSAFIDSDSNVHAWRLVVWLFSLAFVFGPVFFWISDVFTRHVDRGCVQLAKWMEKRCAMR